MSHNESHKKILLLIEKCDALIRAGKISSAAGLINNLNTARVPRGLRQDLAKICRRTGLIDVGLRILHPIIRNEKQLEEPPTAGEICEYAVLLSRNGSIQEALMLLSQVDPREVPEALLYQGYCHISKWEYDKSVGFFERFLQSPAEGYSKLIASVNLASSYIATGELASAERLLDETIEKATQSGASRLAGNCLELRGQVHLLNGDFSRSRQDLDQALRIFGQSNSYDQLLVFKWHSLMNATEEKSPEPLYRFREEALRRKHWESVREADLYTLKLKFDQKAFDHLVFGTPSGAYRARIRRELPHEPSPSYLFGQESSRWLDLETGTLHGSGSLNPGKKIHQVIACLTGDFYVSRNMGSLFTELYPDEYFDVNSSPLRVRQILRRARRWLEQNEIPASIKLSNGGYRLSIDGSFGVRIPLERQVPETNIVKWNEIKSTFRLDVPFTVQDACEKLNLSRSSFHRLAGWALQQGLLKRDGIGKSTLYQISESVSHKKWKQAG